MNEFFSAFNPLLLLGKREEIETLVERPLQPNETLRIDSNGSFHRLKVPSNESGLWPKMLFWLYIHLNKNNHVTAIDQLLIIMDQKLADKAQLVENEYLKITAEIECLKSLKNDYGIQYLGYGEPEKIDEKLAELYIKANHLYALHVKQREIYEEEEQRELFFHFFRESQAILYLLSQESRFGYQQSVRITKLYFEDIFIVFFERLSHIQARLLLAQDLSNNINDMCNKYSIPYYQARLATLRVKLNDEIDKMENELETLMSALKYHSDRHPFDPKLLDYLRIVGLDLAGDKVCVLSFDKESPIENKIVVIQEQLNRFVA